MLLSGKARGRVDTSYARRMISGAGGSWYSKLSGAWWSIMLGDVTAQVGCCVTVRVTAVHSGWESGMLGCVCGRGELEVWAM